MEANKGEATEGMQLVKVNYTQEIGMIKLHPPLRDLPGGAFCSPETSLARLHAATTPVLIIACSDHDRVCFDGLDSNRLIWLQDVANLVAGESAKATIQFAISMKGANDVVLCSHVECTSLRHILTTESAELPEAWRGVGSVLQASIEERYGGLPTRRGELVTAAEHTLNQAEELVRQPCVHRALNAGDLRIHAWVHCDRSGAVYVYDPCSGHFSEAATQA